MPIPPGPVTVTRRTSCAQQHLIGRRDFLFSPYEPGPLHGNIARASLHLLARLFREAVAYRRQFARQISRRNVTLVRIFRQAPLDRPAKRRGRVRILRGDRLGLFAQIATSVSAAVPLRKRAFSRHHFVQHQSRRRTGPSGNPARRRWPAPATYTAPCRASRPAASAIDESALVASATLSAGRRRRFAKPKSRIFTNPSCDTIRFSGFRSRCAMPASCALASPSATCAAISIDLAYRQRAAAQQLAQRLPLDQLHRDVVSGTVLRRARRW